MCADNPSSLRNVDVPEPCGADIPLAGSEEVFSDVVRAFVRAGGRLRIGVVLKRQFPELKLITDFRDEVQYYLMHLDHSPSERRLLAAQRLEREIVYGSNYISAVTQPQLQTIRRRYPEQPDSKFLCIPNGYDPEFFYQNNIYYMGFDFGKIPNSRSIILGIKLAL